MEQARKYLIAAIAGAVLVVIFAPTIIDFYPYDITFRRYYVSSSNALWGGVLNNSVLLVPSELALVLPSYQGDFLQPSGKRNYSLIGSVSSNVSLVFAILDNDSFNEFRINTSVIVSPLLRRDIARGESANFTLSLTNNGVYYYIFASNEPSFGALVRFDLNETWEYEVIEPELQFSIVKGILYPVAIIGGASLLAISLLRLRKIAAEVPEPPPGYPTAETQA